MLTIEMPTVIKTDKNSILFLIRLFKYIESNNSKDVLLDFKNTRFFAGELFCIYHWNIQRLINCGFKIVGININEEIDAATHLSDNHINDDNVPNHKTSILFRNFEDNLNNGDFDCFDRYMKTEFLPKFIQNKNVSNVIVTYLSELFVNSRTHGNTNDIVCGGQIYNTIDKFRFSIVDFGVTIPYNIENYVIGGKQNYFHENDGAAIKWATKEGTSTKKSLGGLGLNSIREFIDDYDGKILIISRCGTYEYSKSGDKIFNTDVCFNGTFIFVELDLNKLKKISKPSLRREVFNI